MSRDHYLLQLMCWFLLVLSAVVLFVWPTYAFVQGGIFMAYGLLLFFLCARFVRDHFEEHTASDQNGLASRLLNSFTAGKDTDSSKHPYADDCYFWALLAGLVLYCFIDFVSFALHHHEVMQIPVLLQVRGFFNEIGKDAYLGIDPAWHAILGRIGFFVLTGVGFITSYWIGRTGKFASAFLLTICFSFLLLAGFYVHGGTIVPHPIFEFEDRMVGHGFLQIVFLRKLGFYEYVRLTGYDTQLRAIGFAGLAVLWGSVCFILYGLMRAMMRHKAAIMPAVVVIIFLVVVQVLNIFMVYQPSFNGLIILMVALLGVVLGMIYSPSRRRYRIYGQ